MNAYMDYGSYVDLTDEDTTMTVEAAVLLTPEDFQIASPEASAGQYTYFANEDGANPFRVSAGAFSASEMIKSKNTYTSFSGADASVSVCFAGGTPVRLGECQTLTYSYYRPMVPVYNLGSAKPSGYVRGPRNIAGSIIFTVFDRHVLLDAFYHSYAGYNASVLGLAIRPDELPAFDFQVTFLNEYGQSAMAVIHDVHLSSEGQVMSIEDMITENTMQYVATDITFMQPNVAEAY